MPDTLPLAVPTTTDWKLEPVVDWLAREGRLIPDPVRLIDEMANRLVASGAPLSRFTLGLQAIHPQFRTLAIAWRRGQKIEQQARAHGIENTPSYIGSPIQELIETRRPVRYRLDTLTPDNHTLLHELAQAGGTDYYATPMRLTHGRPLGLTFTTDRPGGFIESDIEKFHRLMDHLAPIAESHITHRVSTTLMETYLGRIVGIRFCPIMIVIQHVHGCSPKAFRSHPRAVASLTRASSLGTFCPASHW